MYYYYDCKTMSGNSCEIVVKANSKEEALNKLKSYKVNRGELRFYHLVAVSKHGKEKFYRPENNGIILAVAMMGAKLGMAQVNQYGIGTDYRKCLTEETIKILKDNV